MTTASYLRWTISQRRHSDKESICSSERIDPRHLITIDVTRSASTKLPQSDDHRESRARLFISRRFQREFWSILSSVRPLRFFPSAARKFRTHVELIAGRRARFPFRKAPPLFSSENTHRGNISERTRERIRRVLLRREPGRFYLAKKEIYYSDARSEFTRDKWGLCLQRFTIAKLRLSTYVQDSARNFMRHRRF